MARSQARQGGRRTIDENVHHTVKRVYALFRQQKRLDIIQPGKIIQFLKSNKYDNILSRTHVVIQIYALQFCKPA